MIKKIDKIINQWHEEYLEKFISKKGLGKDCYLILDSTNTQTFISFKSIVNELLKEDMEYNFELILAGNEWTFQKSYFDASGSEQTIYIKKGKIDKNFKY